MTLEQGIDKHLSFAALFSAQCSGEHRLQKHHCIYEASGSSAFRTFLAFNTCQRTSRVLSTAINSAWSSWSTCIVLVSCLRWIITCDSVIQALEYDCSTWQRWIVQYVLQSVQGDRVHYVSVILMSVCVWVCTPSYQVKIGSWCKVLFYHIDQQSTMIWQV